MSQTKAQLIDPVDGSLVNADINASAAIAGTKISPDFGSQAITTTGTVNTTLLSSAQTGTGGLIKLARTGTANGEYLFKMLNDSGNDCSLVIRDEKAGASRLTIDSNGTVDVAGNLDVGAGLDVTGGGLTVNSGTANTCATFTSTDSGAVINLTDDSARSSVEQNGTDLKIISDTDAGDAGSTIKFLVDNSTKMTLDSSGRLAIGTTDVGNSDADDLTIANSAHAGITLRSGTSNQGAIYFSDATSGAAQYDGFVGYSQADRAMFFGTAQATRLRIDVNGNMGLGVTPDDSWPTNGDFRALQIGTGACVFGRGSGDEDRGGIAVNYYHTGSAEKYLANGNASGMLLNDGDIDFFVAPSNSSGVDAGMTKTVAMRIAVDSDIGIGTLDPATAMHIAKTHDPVTITLQNTDSNTPTNSGGEIIFKGTKTNGDPIFFGGVGGRRRNQASDVTGYLAFYRQDGDGSNNAIEAGRIDHGGHVYFNGMTGLTASSSVKGVAFENSSNNGRINIHAQSSAGTAAGVLFYHSGNNVGGINYTSSAVIFNTSSDYRLKENVIPISDGITRLKTLKPYRFNFKADPSKTVDGFLAHEVTAVPEAITGTKDEVTTEDNEEKGIKKGDPIYQGIDQSKLVPLLVAAVQELITKVETLEAA
jgi:hypothetical protein